MEKIQSVFLSMLFLAFIFAAPFSGLAAADFRCSGRIISVGDTQDYVLAKCGEPTHVRERTERFANTYRLRYPESHEEFNYVIRERQIEEWTYNLGRTQFVRYLTFRNGRLIAIKTGDYGY